MKKLVTGVLGVAILFNSFAIAAAVDFKDIEETAYYGSILWMEKNGVVEGFQDSIFKPYDCVNRAEFLKMVYKTLEVDVKGTEAVKSYVDIKEGDWFYDYVNYASNKGVIQGYPDGAFKPGNCVNNAEAYKIVLLAFKGRDFVDGFSYNGFYGEESVRPWYYDYLSSAEYANVLMFEEFFDSKHLMDHAAEKMLRGEMAELLYRMKALRDSDGSYFYFGLVPDEIISGTSGFSSCLIGNVSGFAKINALVSEDMDLVFSLNSDEVRRGALNSFIGKVQEGATVDDLAKNVYRNGNPKNSYEKLVKPLLDSDFEVLLGMDLDEGDHAEGILIAGKFANPVGFEKFFGVMMNRNLTTYGGVPVVECERLADDTVLGTVEVDDFYFARYRDVFLVANNAELREKSLESLKRGVVGDWTANFVSYDGKIYDSFVKVGLKYGDVFDFVNDGIAYGDLFFDFDLSGNELSFTSAVEIPSGVFEDFGRYDLKIVNSVPAEDTIVYFEVNSLEDYLEAAGVGIEWLGYYNLEGELADLLGMNEDVINALISHPMGLQVVKSGNDYPGVNVFFDFSGKVEEGRALTQEFANKFDEKLSGGTAFTKAAANHEKNVLPGGNMNKFSVSYKERGADFSGDFYYGMTADNLFVIGFNNNLVEKLQNYQEFGRLGEDLKFKSLVDDLRDGKVSTVFYVDFDVLVEALWIYEQSGEMVLSSNDMKDFVKLISSMDSLMMTGDLKGNALRSLGKLKLK